MIEIAGRKRPALAFVGNTVSVEISASSLGNVARVGNEIEIAVDICRWELDETGRLRNIRRKYVKRSQEQSSVDVVRMNRGVSLPVACENAQAVGAETKRPRLEKPPETGERSSKVPSAEKRASDPGVPQQARRAATAETAASGRARNEHRTVWKDQHATGLRETAAPGGD